MRQGQADSVPSTGLWAVACSVYCWLAYSSPWPGLRSEPDWAHWWARDMHLGVDKKFIDEVTESLTPGMSALFVMVKGGDVNMAIAAFRPYDGKILQTTLSEEKVAALEQELKAGD